MDFVGIDIGASQTRVVSQNGRIGTLPNNSVELPVGQEQTRIMPYNGELENSLEVVITKNGASNIFPMHMMYGTMAERWSSVNVRPSTQQQKYKQNLSYVSILTAAAASRLEFESPEKLTLYVAVPPVEVHRAEEAFKAELVGDFEVKFPKYKDGVTVKLSIVDVKCVEESVMSILSFLFNMDGTLIPTNSKFMRSSILSINIGASTTDLSVVKNGRYLEKSGKTVPVGGNIAREYLIEEVSNQYGFELPIEEANKAMAEGRMLLGGQYEDIKGIVSEAKNVLAGEIMSRLDTYFKGIGIPIQTLGGISVSGGGSLESMYESEGNNAMVVTVPPMSEFVTKHLKDWCPNIEVVPYGKDARLADIKGVFIRAQVDVATAKAKEQPKDDFKI